MSGNAAHSLNQFGILSGFMAEVFRRIGYFIYYSAECLIFAAAKQLTRHIRGENIFRCNDTDRQFLSREIILHSLHKLRTQQWIAFHGTIEFPRNHHFKGIPDSVDGDYDYVFSRPQTY